MHSRYVVGGSLEGDEAEHDGEDAHEADETHAREELRELRTHGEGRGEGARWREEGGG